MFSFTYLLFYCMTMFICEALWVCLVYEKCYLDKVALPNTHRTFHFFLLNVNMYICKFKKKNLPLIFYLTKTTVLPLMFFFMTTNKKRQCNPLCFYSWRPIKKQHCYPLCFFSWRPIKNYSVTPYVFIHDVQ
jgi:hypothetical protein